MSRQGGTQGEEGFVTGVNPRSAGTATGTRTCNLHVVVLAPSAIKCRQSLMELRHSPLELVDDKGGFQGVHVKWQEGAALAAWTARR
jgi:hypothetical protein